MNNILIQFLILTILNVIISTVKSIITVKGDKWSASLISAFYYGFYTIVLMYTVADFPLYQKVIITAGCNLIGVFVVKAIEEKSQKDKLWLVKITIPCLQWDTAKPLLDNYDIPYQFYDIDKYYVVDCFCADRTQTAKAQEICNLCKGKMFAAENKI